MHRFLIYSALIFSLAGCSSTDGIKPSSDFNPAIDFSSYKTFAWISEQPYIGGDPGVSLLTRTRVQESIYDQLIAKNYDFVSDPMTADFVVSYTIGSRQEVSVDSYPGTWRAGWAQQGRGYWDAGDLGGSSFGGSGGTDVWVREYTEGQLAIDIFDVRVKEPSWHGYATKRITSKDRKDPGPIIQTAVEQILSSFPSKS